jgi:transcriptional regulator with XRE-family HTH domain
MANNHRKLFNKWLNKKLKETGMSVEEFSEKVGVSRTTGYAYTRGSVPQLDVAWEIAELFGVTLDEMVGGQSAHDVQECYRRVGEAIRIVEAGGGLPQKSVLQADLDEILAHRPQSKAERNRQVIAALGVFRDLLTTGSPEERGKLAEELLKIALQYKDQQL